MGSRQNTPMPIDFRLLISIWKTLNQPWKSQSVSLPLCPFSKEGWEIIDFNNKNGSFKLQNRTRQ